LGAKKKKEGRRKVSPSNLREKKSPLLGRKGPAAGCNAKTPTGNRILAHLIEERGGEGRKKLRRKKEAARASPSEAGRKKPCTFLPSKRRRKLKIRKGAKGGHYLSSLEERKEGSPQKNPLNTNYEFFTKRKNKNV